MSVLYKVLSAMDIEMRRQESIAQNLAGSQVPGFKGETVLSSDFDGLIGRYNESGQGAIFDGAVVSHDGGALKPTGRPLDFAIAGEGFFEVTTPDGETLYTRNGRFKLSPSGEIQTGDGFSLAASRGDFQLSGEESPNTLTLREDGFLMIGVGENQRELGQLKIVKIEDLQQLERLSASYFKLPAKLQNLATEMIEGEFQVSGRTLESANISPVKEMISMIDCMRKFEMSQRVLKMSDGLKTKEFQTFGS
jgi:flagellar basal body rod protein FlgG